MNKTNDLFVEMAGSEEEYTKIEEYIKTKEQISKLGSSPMEYLNTFYNKGNAKKTSLSLLAQSLGNMKMNIS